jgi:superfamily II DNA or RNA helicase
MVARFQSVISAEIMKLMAKKLKRSLFIAPRRQLVYQASETFTNYGVNNGLIMAGEARFNQPLAQVGSIDTITCRIKSGKIDIPQADAIIVDEAHAVFSKERLDFLSKYKLVIGITSTPALANGKGMGCFYTDIVEGPTMKEIVGMGFLVPMVYFGADAPDLAAVKLNADGDYQEKGLAEASDKPELIGAIYDNYKKIAGDRSTLIFAVNRKHGLHIYQEFLSHGIKADYIDGTTDTDERNAIKELIKGNIDTKVPVTALRKNKNVIVILDKDAISY